MAGRQLGLGAKMKKLHIPDVDPHKPYPMNLPRLGHAVIVNNIHTEMPSSAVDVEALVETYEKLGFEVQVHNDCDARKMGQIKNQILQNDAHRDRNCFLMTVICHGDNRGHLLDKNKNRGWIIEDLISDLSLINSLTGRPKILILQSCRGVEWTDGKAAPRGTLADEDVMEPVILPDKSDMFVAYATVPGYRAHSGDETGSVYLQAFSAYLERWFMREDLDTIYSMVNQYMASIQHGDSGMLQVSEKRSSLRFPLKFSEFHERSSQSSPRARPVPAPKPQRATSDSDHQKEIDLLKQQIENQQKAAADKFEREMREIREKMKKMEEEREAARKREEYERNMKKAAKLTVTKLMESPRAVTTPRRFELKLLSTHDTGLQAWDRTQFTVMSSREVIMWGKSSQEKPAAFHVYNMTPTRWTKQKEVPGLCEHEKVYLHPVRVNNKEQLAVSCWDCHMIRLYNTDTGEVTTAFKDGSHYPGHMCAGERDVLHIINTVEGLPVLELNTRQVPFTVNKTIQSGMEGYYSMHYVLTHKLLVFCDHSPGIIRAVSADRGEKVWEVRGEVDGVQCCPSGLASVPAQGVLLVADGRNKRVLVLHPRDGAHVQTLQLQDLGVIAELCLYQNQLVVWHRRQTEGKEKVSYISIN